MPLLCLASDPRWLQLLPVKDEFKRTKGLQRVYVYSIIRFLDCQYNIFIIMTFSAGLRNMSTPGSLIGGGSTSTSTCVFYKKFRFMDSLVGENLKRTDLNTNII